MGIVGRIGTTGGAIGQTLLAVSPWLPASRPHNAGSITAAWLTPKLNQGVPDAVIEHIRALDGTSGTTARRRLGISWNDAGVEAGLPVSVFVKSTPLSSKNRALVAALSMAVNEVKFYRTARDAVGDLAPKVYAARAGSGARFLLVLEDIRARDARSFALGEECTLHHAREMMKTLARIHAMFWESPRFDGDLRWVAPLTKRSGMNLLALMFRRVRSTFLKSDRYDLAPQVRRMAALVNDNDRALYRQWERPPLTLAHGDSHFGNTYALSDGRAGLLDWQVVFRCRGIREIAYFNGTGLPIEMRRLHERELIALYLDALGSEGVSPSSFEDAWDAYRFFMYDAWDSSAITVLWSGLQAPENVQRAFERTTAAIVDLEVDKAVERALR